MGVPVGDDARRDADSGSGRKSGYVYDEDGLLTTKAAVIAWIGVAALIVGSVSSVMWGWPLPLDGSRYTAAPMSSLVDKPSSGSVADKQMSGRFEVGKDGKLLRPSSAPIPWQPQLPPAATQETPEGMEAFARYVLELVPYMWMSGNTEPLEKASLPECQWASELIRSTKEIYAEQGWIENASIEVLSSGAAQQSTDEPNLWSIDVEFRRSPMTGYNGESIRDFPEVAGTVQFSSRYQDNAWKLVSAVKIK